VVTREVNGGAMMFYQLSVLDDKGGELFVPVEKALAIGVRLLIKKTEIPELMAQLKKPAKSADNWKQRANDNSKLLSSGSPFDLAIIVASLTRLQENRILTLGESGTLGRARRLLVCEISVVTGETRTTAEERIDQALNTGTTSPRVNDRTPL
jgi:CarD family transcriptional regulator